MAYNFEARHDTLRPRMRELNSRTVTYKRGITSGPLSATFYEIDPQELQPYGVSLDIRHVSLIVDVADIESLLGAGAVPEANDEVRDANHSPTLVFLVEPMGDDPPFKYTNHQRKAVRIHAVEVDDTEVS